MSVRLRFAPSPTGYLHVGGARTALFNWLYCRRHGGTFVLRIEDTDVERSSMDMVTGILASMQWLGLTWDEGPGVGGPHAPYFQTERLEKYRAAAASLVKSGHAYRCYCNPDELKAKREAAQAAGGSWSYDRACRNLSDADRAAKEAAGLPSAVRFNVPEGRTSFHDLVHGDIGVDHANIEDFVVLRSDGHPTYHLSVVVDDVEMEITHVVRGDDHISNTPKQVLLYQAMSAPVPAFAHVPLILGPDKKRLSKRHGATSVGEYERLGYLPEAMVNFLALLGWSPGNDDELFTRDELVAKFSLEGISGGNAVFNPEKLDWFNQQHISRMTRRANPFPPGNGSRGGRSRRRCACRSCPDDRVDRSREITRETAFRYRRATPAVHFRGLSQGRGGGRQTPFGARSRAAPGGMARQAHGRLAVRSGDARGLASSGRG